VAYDGIFVQRWKHAWSDRSESGEPAGGPAEDRFVEGAACARGGALVRREAEKVTRRIAMFLPVLLMLAGCASKKAEKRYPMQGEIMALDASAHTATIAAGKIGDWMEAMTMEYPVKPDGEFQKLHVGDRIEATVVVGDPAYYVTEIKIAHK